MVSYKNRHEFPMDTQNLYKNIFDDHKMIMYDFLVVIEGSYNIFLYLHTVTFDFMMFYKDYVKVTDNQRRFIHDFLQSVVDYIRIPGNRRRVI